MPHYPAIGPFMKKSKRDITPSSFNSFKMDNYREVDIFAPMYKEGLLSEITSHHSKSFINS